MSSLPFFCFEGSSVPSGEEAYWVWRSIVSPLFETTVPNRQAVETFRIKIDIHHLGPILIANVASAAQEFRRRPATIARSGYDHYLIQLYPQGGYVGEAEGRTVRVEPGDISILDMSRTLHTRAEAFRNLSLIVPRTVLEPLLKNPDGLHGLVLSGRSGLGYLLASYMQSVHETAASLNAEDGASISKATASLIAGCFGPSADAEEAATTTKRGALVLTIKRYIDANLADPDLTVSRIASEFHVSRATLSRMFEPLDGVAGYIRERRLMRCFAEIASPANAHRPIADLAYSWGFGNEASFSRAFRRMFDMSPREARSGSGGDQGIGRYRLSGSDSPGEAILGQWIRHLRG